MMNRWKSLLSSGVIAVVGFGLVNAQTQLPAELQPESRVVDAGGLALFLKDLQPKSTRETGGKLEVIAPYLHPALTGSFDALAHGWCENPFFLSCGTTHYPINVTVLTGEATREYFRVPATEKFLAIPGGLSRHAASAYLVKNPPASAVWLAWGRNPKEEFLVTGPLLTGSGTTATILKAPYLATTMRKQMFLSELLKQSKRWRP